MRERKKMELLQRYRIPSPGYLEARGSTRLYGVVFVASALVMGVFPAYALMKHGGPRGLWALMGFLGLFALVGLFIAGIWEELQVSPESVTHMRGGWFGKKEHHARRDALTKVRLIRYVVRTNNNTKTLYAPELVFRAPEFPATLRVGSSSREEKARQAAEEISRALELTFEDALGDEPILREPDALDFRSFPTDPSTEPVPKNVLPGWERGVELWIRGTLRPGGGAMAIAAGMLMLVLPTAGLGFALGGLREGSALLLLIALPILAPGVFFTAWGLVSFWACEHIVIRTGAVAYSRNLGPLSWRRRAIPRVEIESLRIQTRGLYGLALVTDRRTLVIGVALEASGLRWLRSWMSERLV